MASSRVRLWKSLKKRSATTRDSSGCTQEVNDPARVHRLVDNSVGLESFLGLLADLGFVTVGPDENFEFAKEADGGGLIVQRFDVVAELLVNGKSVVGGLRVGLQTSKG